MNFPVDDSAIMDPASLEAFMSFDKYSASCVPESTTGRECDEIVVLFETAECVAQPRISKQCHEGHGPPINANAAYKSNT